MTLSKKWAGILAIANLVAAASVTFLWYTIYWRFSAPVVLQDELLFSYLATKDPTSSPFSNTLFSAVFSLSDRCGSEFLSCGRGTNVFLWILFAGVVSLIIYFARSLPVTLLGVWVSTSAISFFAASFLPEIMYYTLTSAGLLFFVLSYTSARYNAIFGVLSALFMGLAMLSKPHAVFIVLLAAIALLIMHFLDKESGRASLTAPFLAVIGAFLIRAAIELAVSNRNPFSLFASYLGSGDSAPSFDLALPIKRPPESDLDTVSIIAGMYETFVPYLLVALFLYLPPLIMGVVLVLRNREVRNLENLGLVIFSFVAFGMLAISFVFGAYVTSLGDDHSSRVLLRYSEFLVPVSWLFLVAAISKHVPWSRRTWAFGAIPFSLGAFGIAVGGLSSIVFSSPDSLLLFSLSGNPFLFVMFLSGILAVFLQTSFKSNTALIVAVAVTSLSLISTSYSHIHSQSTFHVREAEGWSPIVSAVQDLPGDSVVFLGSKRATVASLLLQSGKLESKYGLINGYSEIPPAWVDQFEYAVVSTEIYPPRDSRAIASTADGSVTVYQLRAESGIEDALYLSSPAVESFSSIGVVTDWGYWVDGESTQISLEEPVAPGSKLNVQVLRHEITESSTIAFSTGEEEVQLIELPVAGRLYEIEVTAGAEGIAEFTLGFAETVKIAFVEGMDTYSFGVAKISVLGQD